MGRRRLREGGKAGTKKRMLATALVVLAEALDTV